MLNGIEWGKSMYGGWYVNYISGTKMEGQRCKTLKDLKAWAKENGIQLDKLARDDH